MDELHGCHWIASFSGDDSPPPLFPFFLSFDHTGVQSQRSKQKLKNSIAVTVGGVKCLVESQYISNHDFTEVKVTLKTNSCFI